MKILCPVDFSNTSVHAAEWIVRLLHKLGGGEVHFIHAINIHQRAGIFINVEESLSAKAADDMQALVDGFKFFEGDVKMSTEIVSADPKSYIATLGRKNIYNWIVTGTKGLTALKDMTVGSVTEYLINNSDSTIWTIPSNAEYKDLKKIVLAVDDKILDEEEILQSLKRLCQHFNAHLYMVHVRTFGDSIFEYDPAMDIYLEGIDYSYKALENESTVAATLSNYCDYIEADALCMIHRQKSWFQRLFTKSITKEELFEINLPLLILNAHN